MDRTSKPAATGDGSADAGAFVGRVRELGELRRALQDAASSGGRFFLIGGDAGIGKTRLADELAASAHAGSFAVAWGRCWEGADAPPYWPWVQILRTLLGSQPAAGALQRSEVDALSQIVPELREGGATTKASHSGARFALFDIVSMSLQRISETQPLLLVFDDLHAADEASLLLLRFFARQIRNTRILGLGTYRSDEVAPASLAAEVLAALARAGGRMTLPGLAEEDVASIFEATAGHPAPTQVVTAVWRATEGNPLFVHEVIDQFMGQGAIHRPDYSMGFRVPQGARDLLAQRVARLPDQTRHVLAVAAVVGREFDVVLLDRVTATGIDPLVEALEEAVGGGVLKEESALGRYRFAHVLMRETLYEGLPPAIRMRMHRDVATAIEEIHRQKLDAHVGELAHHYFKAGRVGNLDRALDYSLRAAQKAEEQLAFEEAVHHYQRALKLAEVADAPEAQRQGLLTSIDRVNRLTLEPQPIDVGAPVGQEEENVFRREGEFWTLSFGGSTVRMKDSKGLRYLALLLREPGREFHCLDIARQVEGAVSEPRAPAADELPGDAFADAGAVLDSAAKAQYKKRLADLHEDLEEAEAFNDPERAVPLRQEIDFLVEELKAATGLGGRDRKAAAPAERARVAVTRAIRLALRRIDQDHPLLGRHLSTTIRTGNYFSYNPDERLPPLWVV